MDSLLFDFNKIINKIIEKITNDIFFQQNLNYCNFLNLENLKIVNKPIMFCLGGMAYKIYEYIISKNISKNINTTMVTKTQDYDFSFSLKNNDKTTLISLTNLIIEIFNTSIDDYSYTLDITS
jgi:hypothetical protein